MKQRKSITTALVILGLVTFWLFFHWWTYSRPEYADTISFLKTNPQIAQKFGAIQSYKLDDIKSDVEWRGTGFNLNNGQYIGEYQFSVVGSKMPGIVKINWISDADHDIRFEEIDSFQESGAKEILWKTEGS